MYSLADFDFHLPPELIAQVPLATRSSSRLLQVKGDQVADRSFSDITTLLQPGDVLRVDALGNLCIAIGRGAPA